MLVAHNRAFEAAVAQTLENMIGLVAETNRIGQIEGRRCVGQRLDDRRLASQLESVGRPKIVRNLQRRRYEWR